MMLPDAYIEDVDSNERGTAIWFVIADQGFDADPLTGHVLRMTNEGDFWMVPKGAEPDPDLYWFWGEPEDGSLDALDRPIGYEARCIKCNESFCPNDKQDLVHLLRADETECGGLGVLVGSWR